MSEPTYDDRDTKNRIRVAHLVVGLVFLGLAASWALHAGGVIGDPQTSVVLPTVLVAAGVIGLLVTVVGSRRRRTPVHDTTTQVHDTTTQDTYDDTKEIER